MKASRCKRTLSLKSLTAVFAVFGLVLAVTACSSEPAETDTAAEPGVSDAPSADETTDQEGPADDASSAAPERHPNLPEEMPIPDYAAYAFSIDPLIYYQTSVPVAVLIDDMEHLLAEQGWDVVERVEKVAWGNDVLLRVDGHGYEMDVYIEPTAGSETESQVVYVPGGGFL